MKKLFLGLAVIFCTHTFFAQGIILTTPATASYGLISPVPSTVVNNDTVTYCVADLFTTFEEGKLICINNTASPIDIKVKRFAHANDCFTSNQFCWTICYAAGTSVSPDSIRIPANDSSVAFHGWMTPDGTQGCCFIKYRFFNEDDTSMYAETTIKYCFSSNCSAPDLSIGQNGDEWMNIYPNPAMEVFNISMVPSSEEGLVRITNELGQTVKQITVQPNTGLIQVQRDDLKSGTYFCHFYLNGRFVTARKMVLG
jgi:hypothetical protein